MVKTIVLILLLLTISCNCTQADNYRIVQKAYPKAEIYNVSNYCTFIVDSCGKVFYIETGEGCGIAHIEKIFEYKR